MRSVVDRLLFTPEGRRTLVVAYVVAAVTSVVVYAISRDLVYALGQAILFTAAALWVRWCLQRR